MTSARLKEPRRAGFLFLLLLLLSSHGNVSAQSMNFPGMRGVLKGNKPREVCSTVRGSVLAGSLKINVFRGGGKPSCHKRPKRVFLSFFLLSISDGINNETFLHNNRKFQIENQQCLTNRCLVLRWHRHDCGSRIKVPMTYLFTYARYLYINMTYAYTLKSV